MKNHITKYMRKVGDSVEPSYADLFDRIEALEGELIEVKDLLEIRSHFADAQQREKVKAHVQLTQYRVALERCVGALNACTDTFGHTKHWDYTMQAGAGCPVCIKQHEARVVVNLAKDLATPLIEKGRK